MACLQVSVDGFLLVCFFHIYFVALQGPVSREEKRAVFVQSRHHYNVRLQMARTWGRS